LEAPQGRLHVRAVRVTRHAQESRRHAEQTKHLIAGELPDFEELQIAGADTQLLVLRAGTENRYFSAGLAVSLPPCLAHEVHLIARQHLVAGEETRGYAAVIPEQRHPISPEVKVEVVRCG